VVHAATYSWAVTRILIVDDDSNFRGKLCTGLSETGYACEDAADSESARARLAGAAPYDLILLDVTLPTASGFELLEWMRTGGDATPVIFLTAHTSCADRVRGLRLGADDYVAKPFELEELLARIEAVLRRQRPPVVYEIGDVRIDLAARKASLAGRDLELSQRELALVEALIEAEGAVLSRADLLSRVWGIRGATATNIVDVIVMRARRKLDRGGGHSIQTVVGEGYRVKARRVRG